MTGHTYEILLTLGILSPFVGFWILVFFGPKLGKPAAGWVGVILGMGIPLVLATYVVIGWLGDLESGRTAELTAGAFRYHWAMVGAVPATIGIKLDSLTVCVYFMVTVVAFLIFVFSVGYMSGHSDEVDGQCKYSRFFAFLSLFGFSMLGLVASSSLLFLFIFWELVGLCSYFLIGFYFDKAFASAAAIKAFITNRVGDFGFLIGLMLVYFQLKTLDLDEAAAIFAQQYADGTGVFASHFTFLGLSLATIMGIGLFCGAMGKSAQFPLHVWLPDAMAGPTPVSALIHAATMVAAGVYLVARVFRLMTPDALWFVALIGCLTLTLMALIAIVQVDIKKCLAYSTLSQLGYMIFGMGCGAWIAALFHLITHAFFKAMLFLCSGQVIEGCHHEQDMRKMGGLRRKMPVTCWTFFVGVLAISGAGIAGTKLGLGGFFSKDEILAVAYTRAFEWDDYSKHEDHGSQGGHAGAGVAPTARLASFQDEPSRSLSHDDEPSGYRPGDKRLYGGALQNDAHGGHEEWHRASENQAIFAKIPPLPKWMFYLAIFTAYVTPFYMTRCWWMTFMGKPRDEHVHHHAHEIPLMYVPLIVLAVGTLFSSYFLFRPLIADAAPEATSAAVVLATDGHLHTDAIGAAHHWLKFGVGGAFIVGFVIAFAIYGRGLAVAEALKRTFRPLHLLLERKYFFDEVYDFVWVKGCVLTARIIRLIDTYVVDLLFDIAAAITARLATFSGMILDNEGVDGVVNGIAKSTTDLAGVVRTPQTGRIRDYVLFATAVATVVLICVLIFGPESAEAATTARSVVP
ncbi:MAG: NADH-quinone oxidoreductase subunit L [Planctomycetota bacterium]|jgi:proton-translocating NADH-quinone oxidoreductase chain L